MKEPVRWRDPTGGAETDVRALLQEATADAPPSDEIGSIWSALAPRLDGFDQVPSHDSAREAGPDGNFLAPGKNPNLTNIAVTGGTSALVTKTSVVLLLAATVGTVVGVRSILSPGPHEPMVKHGEAPTLPADAPRPVRRSKAPITLGMQAHEAPITLGMQAIEPAITLGTQAHGKAPITLGMQGHGMQGHGMQGQARSEVIPGAKEDRTTTRSPASWTARPSPTSMGMPRERQTNRMPRTDRRTRPVTVATVPKASKGQAEGSGAPTTLRDHPVPRDLADSIARSRVLTEDLGGRPKTVSPPAVSPTGSNFGMRETAGNPGVPDAPAPALPAAIPVNELLKESRCLDRARAALRVDNPDLALDLLANCPAGTRMLAQEREALTIKAEAAKPALRETAQRRARAFMRAYPDSPYRARVRALILK